MKLVNKITIILLLCGFIIQTGNAQKVVDVNISQKKEISLVDIWAKGTFYPKTIQGLKSLGKENINMEELTLIKQIIEEAEAKDEIIKNIRLAPVWIQRIGLEIIKTDKK